MSRHSVNKRNSSRKFRKSSSKTRPINMVQRGGYRL